MVAGATELMLWRTNPWKDLHNVLCAMNDGPCNEVRMGGLTSGIALEGLLGQALIILYSRTCFVHEVQCTRGIDISVHRQCDARERLTR